MSVLSGTHFNFTGRTLTNLYLNQADLSESILNNADFSNSDLRSVDFSFASLFRTSLVNCNLIQINLGLNDILTNHKREITSLAFSSDGKHLAAASKDNTVSISCTTTRTIVYLIRLNKSITDIAYSDILAVSCQTAQTGLIYFWYCCSPESLNYFDQTDYPVTSMSFSPNHRYLACSCSDMVNSNVLVWDAITSELLYSIQGHSQEITCIQFSLDSSLLTSGALDNRVRFWSIQREKFTAVTITTKRGILALAFSKNNSLLAIGTFSPIVTTWVYQTGQLYAKYKGLNSEVSCVAFCPNQSLLAAGSRAIQHFSMIRIWHVHTSETYYTFHDHSISVNSIAFSPNGALLAQTGLYPLTKFQGTIKLWNINEKCNRWIDNEYGEIHCVCIDKNEQYIACGGLTEDQRGFVSLWELVTGKFIVKTQKHQLSVRSVCFSICGSYVASGSKDYSVLEWDWGNEVTKQLPRVHSDEVSSIVYSHNGEFLASASLDTLICLYKDSKLYRTFTDHLSRVISVVFSLDNELIIAGYEDSIIFIWRITDNSIVYSYKTSDEILSITLATSCIIVSSGYGVISKIENGAEQFQCLLNNANVQCLSISLVPDSELLVLGMTDITRFYTGHIGILNLSNGQLIKQFLAHSSTIHSVVYSPTKNLIISGSKDGTLKLWDNDLSFSLN